MISRNSLLSKVFRSHFQLYFIIRAPFDLTNDFEIVVIDCTMKDISFYAEIDSKKVPETAGITP